MEWIASYFLSNPAQRRVVFEKFNSVRILFHLNTLKVILHMSYPSLFIKVSHIAKLSIFASAQTTDEDVPPVCHGQIFHGIF